MVLLLTLTLARRHSLREFSFILVRISAMHEVMTVAVNDYRVVGYIRGSNLSCLFVV